MTDDFRFYVGLGQWLLTGAIGIYAWLSQRQSANAQEVQDLTLRVTTLEEQMRHLPDQGLVNELAGDMKAVKAELAGLREAMAPLTRSIERVNDYLLNQK